MAPMGDVKPGLQLWEMLLGARAGFPVTALSVQASNSVFLSKRINMGAVYNPYWTFNISETKVNFFSYSPRIRGLNELQKGIQLIQL